MNSGVSKSGLHRECNGSDDMKSAFTRELVSLIIAVVIGVLSLNYL